ncbi:hypothetical protein [Tautonia plasticadhaerens]|uniref:Uncharacterized protein n=1 Tax=Tautonia plasticadhaerens TaxID=2527974 RepID=A0A518H3R0_9BACT|nr:hypothetical protein [Tautonia plasticadhaerens]QDV35496.1 hypothetical protein ElP_33990 [Tautonia plasticadhaerens]
MLIRIFDRGAATVIEAPADVVVHRGRVLGLPDMLEVRGAAGQEAVLLTESVAVSAARLGLYGLKVVEQPVARVRA